MAKKWETVDQIREFNRFYTVLQGFLNRNYLESGYSVTETRILFELKQNREMSANRIIETLHLDKGYISRLIRNFEQKGLIARKTASADRRALLIQLTAKGQEETERLIEKTNEEIIIRTYRPGDPSRVCYFYYQLFAEQYHFNGSWRNILSGERAALIRQY
ncbi:MAG: MarR family winged helix-turn-helix transcriptional regulator [Eubacteriales bacterium]|nr:MarR family winged helix-turn-helix transcriptional regulator [Eubacteriales bacterium]